MNTNVYYFLAKDEERRMLNSHEGTYREYMKKTGMFMPRGIEQAITPSAMGGKAALAVFFAALVIGAVFFLRVYTINHLTLWTKANTTSSISCPKTTSCRA